MNDDLFPVVILSGGLATRLKPISQSIPKALIEINGEPFIHHQLHLLASQGIKNVLLCVGYLGEMIEQTIGSGKTLGLNVNYSYDGEHLLGTAGAIKKALPLLSESFFVLYGDSYLTCDFHAIQKTYQIEMKQGLMTIFRNNGLWDTSNVEFENGQILAYDKKNLTPSMHYIDYGLGILNKAAFAFIADNEKYDLAILYQQLLQHKQLAAHEVKQRFFEVGSFAGIKELENHLLENHS